MLSEGAVRTRPSGKVVTTTHVPLEQDCAIEFSLTGARTGSKVSSEISTNTHYGPLSLRGMQRAGFTSVSPF